MYREHDERNSDREKHRAVKSFLREGEELLWMGQPYTKAKYRPSAYTVFFSLFFFGFAVFWTVMASAGGGLFGLFGLPFLGIGAYLVYSVLFGAKKTFQNTVYAVTPQRAIVIIATRSGLQCRDFYFATTPSVQITALNGDCGTINLCPHLAYDASYYDYHGSHRQTQLSIGGRRFSSLSGEYYTSFEMIENVQEVYNLITDCIMKIHQSS